MFIQKIVDSFNKKSLIPAVMLAVLLPALWGGLLYYYLDNRSSCPRFILGLIEIPIFPVDELFKAVSLRMGLIDYSYYVPCIIVGCLLFLFSVGLWLGYSGSLIVQWFMKRKREGSQGERH